MAFAKKILLNGRACSGKDTIADYLNYYGFRKFSFATGIYHIAYNMFDMKEKDRSLLQQIGEKMREIKPTVWVDTTYRMSESHSLENNSVVITDCRRVNEYVKGVDLGYVPIRVTADLDVRVRRTLIRDNGIDANNPYLDLMIKQVINRDTEPHHPYHLDISKWENASENGADNCAYTEVTNNGTKAELFFKIDKIISSI